MMDAGRWFLLRGCGCGIMDDEGQVVEGRRLMAADNLKISEFRYPFSDFCHLSSGRSKPGTHRFERRIEIV
jgi:hypothetical protein